MDMLIPIIYFALFVIASIAFFNVGLSIALCLGSIILIPQFVKIPLLVLGEAPFIYTIGVLYLILLLLKQKYGDGKKKYFLDIAIVKPYLFLFASLFFLIFFEWSTPWEFQIAQLFKDAFKACSFSFVIWNVLNIHPQKNIQYIKWSLIIAISIAVVYGIFLTQLGGINPYTSFLADYFNIDQDNAEAYAGANSRLGSLSGKVQATMTHPMTWAFHLCLLSVIYAAYAIKAEKKIGYWILIGFIMFSVLISGVRTGIAALIIGFFYYFIRQRKFKLIFYACLALVGVMLLGDDLTNLFLSFIDISGVKSNVQGSTIAMRLEQLDGVFQEIHGYKLWAGKGYGWHNYYYLNYGFHPTIIGFESLIFTVLCDSGFIGAGIWVIFFLLLLKLQRKLLPMKTDIYLMDTMVLVYASYAIGTGEYGYMFPFSIYYTFLMCMLRNEKYDFRRI